MQLKKSDFTQNYILSIYAEDFLSKSDLLSKLEEIAEREVSGSAGWVDNCFFHWAISPDKVEEVKEILRQYGYGYFI